MLFLNNSFFFQVNVGDRIAQLICERYSRVLPIVVGVGELEGTERGEGGFGSTGLAGDVKFIFEYIYRQFFSR
jgi:dUTPase